jgi:hypothetical protein
MKVFRLKLPVSSEAMPQTKGPEVWLHAILNRNAVSPSSPGLPLRLPWGSRMKHHSTAKRLRHFLDESKTGATALRLGINEYSLPRVAEAATLGWRPKPRCGSPF